MKKALSIGFAFAILFPVFGIAKTITVDYPIATASTTLTTAFSTSTMIYELWGKEEGDKMLAVAQCESRMRQTGTDGKVLVSPTHDFGLMQINEATWDKKAAELGLDYKGSVIDNIQMAKYIWDRQSISAWTCAKILALI